MIRLTSLEKADNSHGIIQFFASLYAVIKRSNIPVLGVVGSQPY